MTDPNAITEIHYEVAGTPLYAVERGRGRPVVFFHGGLADHRGSLLRVGGLADSHRLITPDVRGAGRSHFSDELGWELLADDVAALLRHLGLGCAVVGGTSAGSAVALAFARRHPRLVEALLLVSPVYAGQDRGLSPAQRAATTRMHEYGRRAAVEGVAALLPLFAELPPALRDVAVAVAREFDPGSVAATTRFLASGVHPFARLEELAALSMPTLVVPGVDPEHPAEIAELYAQSFTNAALADPTADLAATVAAFLRDALR